MFEQKSLNKIDGDYFNIISIYVNMIVSKVGQNEEP